MLNARIQYLDSIRSITLTSHGLVDDLVVVLVICFISHSTSFVEGNEVKMFGYES